ncbi:hypothetical protein VTN77DRAFT_3485 [Rasamsonia byssochlamydoides]|uniref:uncharacterized protein n=1 Tax=Rasamsonia byssochlamydoides TaxID=89139 RepID=UPI0037432413
MATAVSHLQPSDLKSMMCGKRKLRIPKACYQCYKRKVKCDRTSPCALCVKRGHAHLCTYTHPSKKPSPLLSPGSDGERTMRDGRRPTAGHASRDKKAERVLVDSREWKIINEKLAEMSESISSLRSKLEQVSTTVSSSASDSGPEIEPQSTNSETEGIHMRNVLGGSPVHFGSSSVLAFILERSTRSSTAGSVFREDGILPQLALEDQAATYPFLDLWSSELMSVGSAAVCAALPDDNLCRRLFRFYRDIRTTLYPVLTDIDQFERDVEKLLRNRSLNGLQTTNVMDPVEPFGMSTAFIGILFAVLASGCQLSDLPKKERILLCQVYVSCSYQCLRNGNFLSRPTVEAIQTLLILGDVLSYNMNPGVAYVTFGMAQRMALTLGLHIESATFPSDELFVRRRLWWSMAWQDSHFALSYDRPAETLAPNPQIPYEQSTGPGNRGYFETMCRVISLTLQLLREEALSGQPQIKSTAIPEYKAELDRVLADAAPYLRNEDHCFNMTNHIERLTLKLRSSYLISEICRRSVKPSNCPGKRTTTTSLCMECVESLINTVKAYVELHEIIPNGSRSWIHLHSAISASFLLAVDEGSQSNPSVWTALEKLEDVLVDLTSADGEDAYAYSPESLNHITPMHISGQTDMLYDFPIVPEVAMTDDVEPSGAAEVDFLTRTLDALRKINAGFSAQKARMSAEDGGSNKPPEKGKGGCCSSRYHC